MSEVPLPDGEVREPELKLAKQLIDQIASETFDPTQYHDDVRERIQADIERKVQGQEITEGAEPPAEPARIIDLMAALKASLGKAAAAKSAHSAPPAEAVDAPAESATPRRGARRSEAAEGEAKRARKK